MHRHLSPLARILLIRKQLCHELPRREPPLAEASLLPVLAEDDIVPIQDTRRARRHRLLASTDNVEAQATLPLGVEHDDVEDGRVQHVGVQLDNRLGGYVGLKGRVHDVAVLVDNAVGGQGGP